MRMNRHVAAALAFTMAATSACATKTCVRAEDASRTAGENRRVVIRVVVT